MSRNDKTLDLDSERGASPLADFVGKKSSDSPAVSLGKIGLEEARSAEPFRIKREKLASVEEKREREKSRRVFPERKVRKWATIPSYSDRLPSRNFSLPGDVFDTAREEEEAVEEIIWRGNAKIRDVVKREAAMKYASEKVGDVYGDKVAALHLLLLKGAAATVVGEEPTEPESPGLFLNVLVPDVPEEPTVEDLRDMGEIGEWIENTTNYERWEVKDISNRKSFVGTVYYDDDEIGGGELVESLVKLRGKQKIEAQRNLNAHRDLVRAHGPPCMRLLVKAAYDHYANSLMFSHSLQLLQMARLTLPKWRNYYFWNASSRGERSDVRYDETQPSPPELEGPPLSEGVRVRLAALYDRHKAAYSRTLNQMELLSLIAAGRLHLFATEDLAELAGDMGCTLPYVLDVLSGFEIGGLSEEDFRLRSISEKKVEPSSFSPKRVLADARKNDEVWQEEHFSDRVASALTLARFDQMVEFAISACDAYDEAIRLSPSESADDPPPFDLSSRPLHVKAAAAFYLALLVKTLLEKGALFDENTIDLRRRKISGIPAPTTEGEAETETETTGGSLFISGIHAYGATELPEDVHEAFVEKVKLLDAAVREAVELQKTDREGDYMGMLAEMFKFHDLTEDVQKKAKYSSRRSAGLSAADDLKKSELVTFDDYQFSVFHKILEPLLAEDEGVGLCYFYYDQKKELIEDEILIRMLMHLTTILYEKHNVVYNNYKEEDRSKRGGAKKRVLFTTEEDVADAFPKPPDKKKEVERMTTLLLATKFRDFCSRANSVDGAELARLLSEVETLDRENDDWIRQRGDPMATAADVAALDVLIVGNRSRFVERTAGIARIRRLLEVRSLLREVDNELRRLASRDYSPDRALESCERIKRSRHAVLTFFCDEWKRDTENLTTAALLRYLLEIDGGTGSLRAPPVFSAHFPDWAVVDGLAGTTSIVDDLKRAREDPSSPGLDMVMHGAVEKFAVYSAAAVLCGIVWLGGHLNPWAPLVEVAASSLFKSPRSVGTEEPSTLPPVANVAVNVTAPNVSPSCVLEEMRYDLYDVGQNRTLIFPEGLEGLTLDPETGTHVANSDFVFGAIRYCNETFSTIANLTENPSRFAFGEERLDLQRLRNVTEKTFEGDVETREAADWHVVTSLSKIYVYQRSLMARAATNPKEKEFSAILEAERVAYREAENVSDAYSYVFSRKPSHEKVLGLDEELEAEFHRGTANPKTTYPFADRRPHPSYRHARLTAGIFSYSKRTKELLEKAAAYENEAETERKAKSKEGHLFGFYARALGRRGAGLINVTPLASLVTGLVTVGHAWGTGTGMDLASNYVSRLAGNVLSSVGASVTGLCLSLRSARRTPRFEKGKEHLKNALNEIYYRASRNTKHLWYALATGYAASNATDAFAVLQGMFSTSLFSPWTFLILFGFVEGGIAYAKWKKINDELEEERTFQRNYDRLAGIFAVAARQRCTAAPGSSDLLLSFFGRDVVHRMLIYVELMGLYQASVSEGGGVQSTVFATDRLWRIAYNGFVLWSQYVGDSLTSYAKQADRVFQLLMSAENVKSERRRFEEAEEYAGFLETRRRSEKERLDKLQEDLSNAAKKDQSKLAKRSTATYFLKKMGAFYERIEKTTWFTKLFGRSLASSTGGYGEAIKMSEYAVNLSRIFEIASFVVSTCTVVRSAPLMNEFEVQKQLTHWYGGAPGEETARVLKRFSKRYGEADLNLNLWLGNLLAGDWKSFLTGARSRGIPVPELIKVTYNSFFSEPGSRFVWGDWWRIFTTNPALATFYAAFGTAVPFRILSVSCKSFLDLEEIVRNEAAPALAQMAQEEGWVKERIAMVPKQ
jgi:hypothetical protein